MASPKANPPERREVSKNEAENLKDCINSDQPTTTHRLQAVYIRGHPLVCLLIGEQERMCLAQISSTLLHNYSYNEIHNRRVALGITCVQCSPTQLDALREAGAMPNCSRRCGTITRREAERLVKSFLDEPESPRLPDNFVFNVVHHCGWGCKGSFIPSKYNSSRAKCIRCCLCQVYFSPNKFIFHSHRKASASDIETAAATYRHPDAANFNAWRRHLFLRDANPPTQLLYAWEDVKAMFNGGNRKRWPENGQILELQKSDKGERRSDLICCYPERVTDLNESKFNQPLNRCERKDSNCAQSGIVTNNWIPFLPRYESSTKVADDHNLSGTNSCNLNHQKNHCMMKSVSFKLENGYPKDTDGLNTYNAQNSLSSYEKLVQVTNDTSKVTKGQPLGREGYSMNLPHLNNNTMLRPYHALLPEESLIKNSVAYSWSLWLAYRFLNPRSSPSSPEQSISASPSNTQDSGLSRPFRMSLYNTNKN